MSIRKSKTIPAAAGFLMSAAGTLHVTALRVSSRCDSVTVESFKALWESGVGTDTTYDSWNEFANSFGFKVEVTEQHDKVISHPKLEDVKSSKEIRDLISKKDKDFNFTVSVKQLLQQQDLDSQTKISTLMLLVLIQLNRVKRSLGPDDVKPSIPEVASALHVLLLLLSTEMQLDAFTDRIVVWTGGNGLEAVAHHRLGKIPINYSITLRLAGLIGARLKAKSLEDLDLSGKGCFKHLWNNLSETYAAYGRGEYADANLNIGEHRYELSLADNVYTSSLTKKVMFKTELPTFFKQFWDSHKMGGDRSKCIKKGVKIQAVVGDTYIDNDMVDDLEREVDDLERENGMSEYKPRMSEYVKKCEFLEAETVDFIENFKKFENEEEALNDFLERASQVALRQQAAVALFDIIMMNKVSEESDDGKVAFPFYATWQGEGAGRVEWNEVVSEMTNKGFTTPIPIDIAKLRRSFEIGVHAAWNRRIFDDKNFQDAAAKQAIVALRVLDSWHKNHKAKDNTGKANQLPKVLLTSMRNFVDFCGKTLGMKQLEQLKESGKGSSTDAQILRVKTGFNIADDHQLVAGGPTSGSCRARAIFGNIWRQ